MFFAISFSACKKNDINQFQQQQLDVHNLQVNTWIKMFQVNEQIKANTPKVFSTVYSKEQFISRLQVGESGNYLYFISEKNKFSTYGIKSELISGKTSGLVEVFDFQKMQKSGLRFNSSGLTSIVTYPKEPHFNLLNSQSNIQSYRTTNIISGIRKFFCELFGGAWLTLAAGQTTDPGGSCHTGSTGEAGVQNLPNDVGGGGWGLIFANINNPSFFGSGNTGFWLNNLTNPSIMPSGGGNSNPYTQPIIQLSLEQKRDFLISTLNLNSTQEFHLVNTSGMVEVIFNFLQQHSFSDSNASHVISILDLLINDQSLNAEQLNSYFFTIDEEKDGSYDSNYWDNLNAVSPPETLPSLINFYNAFPKNVKNGKVYKMESDDVFTLVGGDMNVENKQENPDYQNACAVRGSRALNYAGKPIPDGTGGTEKGDDGKNYILSAKAFNKYMNKKFGPPPPDHRLTKAEINGDPKKIADFLKGKNGIYTMIISGKSFSGHIDLILNGIVVGGTAIGSFISNVEFIEIWPLN